MADLSFKQYSDQVLPLARYPNIGSNMLYPALGLAGETGEYCEKLKKVIRDFGGVPTELDRRSMAKELGDVLWYVLASASEIGYTLEQIAQMNLDKLHLRHATNTLHGSGDDREETSIPSRRGL